MVYKYECNAMRKSSSVCHNPVSSSQPTQWAVSVCVCRGAQLFFYLGRRRGRGRWAGCLPGPCVQRPTLLASWNDRLMWYLRHFFRLGYCRSNGTGSQPGFDMLFSLLPSHPLGWLPVVLLIPGHASAAPEELWHWLSQVLSEIVIISLFFIQQLSQIAQ